MKKLFVTMLFCGIASFMTSCGEASSTSDLETPTIQDTTITEQNAEAEAEKLVKELENL